MENKIEIHLNKVFKEYLDVKNYLLSLDKQSIKDEVTQKSLLIDSDEELSNYYFEKLGYLRALEGDLSQLQGRLFHVYDYYKEITEEKNQDIEKELQDITFKLTYSVKGDELTLVDKEAYEFYKKQFIESQKYAKFKMGK